MQSFQNSQMFNSSSSHSLQRSFLTRSFSHLKQSYNSAADSLNSSRTSVKSSFLFHQQQPLYSSYQNSRIHHPSNNHKQLQRSHSNISLVSNKKLKNIQCILSSTQSRGGLYLGDIIATKKPNIIEDYQIKGLLSCMDNADYCEIIRSNCSFYQKSRKDYEGNRIVVKDLAVKDQPNCQISRYFSQCNQFLDRMLWKERRNVLVHCHAGVSRSATIVCAYLMHLRGQKKPGLFNEAFMYLKSRRERVRPNEGFIKQLQLYQKQLLNLSTHLHNQNNINRSLQNIEHSSSRNKISEQNSSKQKKFKQIHPLLKQQAQNNNSIAHNQQRKPKKRQDNCFGSRIRTKIFATQNYDSAQIQNKDKAFGTMLRNKVTTLNGLPNNCQKYQFDKQNIRNINRNLSQQSHSRQKNIQYNNFNNKLDHNNIMVNNSMNKQFSQSQSKYRNNFIHISRKNQGHTIKRYY